MTKDKSEKTEWMPTIGMVVFMTVFLVVSSLVGGCTFAPPAGVDTEVDTVFGDVKYKAPDSLNRVDERDRAVNACLGPLSHAGDSPASRAVACDCLRDRGRTDTHLYNLNCLARPGGEIPVLNKEQGVEVRPETPRGGQLEQALRKAEGVADGEYTLDGVIHSGIGNNTQDEQKLAENIEEARAATESVLGTPAYNKLNNARKDALHELAFWVGETKLAEFTEMIRSIKNELYNSAADHLLDSALARRFPSRAGRIAAVLRNGKN